MHQHLILSRIVVVVSLVAVTGRGHAQTNLSGSWTFKDQQAITGTLYSNGSPKSVTIVQGAGSIQITKVTAGDGGDVTTSETITFDGQPFQTTTASKRKKTTAGQWSSDKITFTEIALVYDASDSTKLYFRTTDTWFLENGELVLDRKAENQANGEIWESKAVYDKL